VLGVVPALYPAVAGLQPPDDDLHEEEHPTAAEAVTTGAGTPLAPEAPGRPDPGGGRGGGGVMRSRRRYGLAPLFLAAGLGLTGCQAAAQGAGAEEVADRPAVVEPAEDGGPASLTLIPEAEERLGLETGAVAVGGQGKLSVPYEAVVYDTEGAAWAFERTGTGTYRRTALTIGDVVDGQALLGAGPAAGTEVVTVGAAELVGVEAGLTGGE
jgi:hypothetical protein